MRLGNAEKPGLWRGDSGVGEGDIAFWPILAPQATADHKGRGGLSLALKGAADYLARDCRGPIPAYYARVASLLHPFPAPRWRASDGDRRIGCAGGVSIGPRGHRPRCTGDGVVIHGGCVIGDGVSIGEGACCMAGPPFYPGCRIGKRAIIHSGAVIGADGFDLPRTRAPGSRFLRSAAWWSVMTSKSEPIIRSIGEP